MHLSLGPPGPRVLTGEDHKMLYPFPGPQSSPKRINPKGVYPMESNVFDVVSLTSTCSVPGPLSMLALKVEVLISKCRPK